MIKDLEVTMELKTAVMNSAIALKKLLGLPCIARDPDLVATIDATLDVLARLEGDVSETRAKAIAGESEGTNSPLALVESGDERFGSISEKMADIRSRQEWAATLTGSDRTLAFRAIDADMAAVDRQI